MQQGKNLLYFPLERGEPVPKKWKADLLSSFLAADAVGHLLGVENESSPCL